MQLKLNELDWANRGRQSDKVLTGTAPESSECSSQPVIATESPERKYSPPVHDLDWALLAAAEEMKFDWRSSCLWIGKKWGSRKSLWDDSILRVHGALWLAFPTFRFLNKTETSFAAGSAKLEFYLAGRA
jgi:hypothetical protein